MADAAVRSRKPATNKRTPAGGAPTAAHTAAEASEARIDIDAVTDLLLGTWGDTRREAREMIKDPAFWQVAGLPMAEHRERVLTQLHLLVEGCRRLREAVLAADVDRQRQQSRFLEAKFRGGDLQL